MNYLITPFIILCISLFTVFGDSFIKKAGIGQTNWKYLLIGLAIYSTTTFIWFFIYKSTKFFIAGSMYGVFTVLIFTFFSIFMFKETLSLIEVIGIIMAISSILMLSRFS